MEFDKMRFKHLNSLIYTNKLIILLAVVSLCLYFSFQLFYGEVIPANNGLGFDGVIYDSIAKLSLSKNLSHTLNPYYLHRMLASVIVHEVAKLLHFNIKESVNMVFAFRLLNICLIVVGSFIFYSIGKILGWSIQTRILCLSFLILNFPSLKLDIYYPVLTDISAFFLGILSLYFYIQRNRFAVLMMLLLGAFTFPTLVYVMAPLFIFPRKMEDKNPFLHTPNYLISSIITVCIGMWMVYSTFKPVPLNINWMLWPLSFLTMLGYFFCAIRYLIYPRIIFNSIFKQISFINLFLYICLLIIINFITHRYSNNAPAAMDASTFFILIANEALANPLISLICHFIFFGPGVILLVLLWPAITKVAYEFGLGYVGFIFIYLIFSMGSEAREFINAWPMFVLLLGCELNKFKINWSCTVILSLFCLIVSHFWLPINSESATGVIELSGLLYFMNFGPWVTMPIYMVFAMLSFIMFIALYYMLKVELKPGIETQTLYKSNNPLTLNM